MEDTRSTICTVPLSELGLKLSALRLCQPAADGGNRVDLAKLTKHPPAPACIKLLSGRALVDIVSVPRGQ